MDKEESGLELAPATEARHTTSGHLDPPLPRHQCDAITAGSGHPVPTSTNSPASARVGEPALEPPQFDVWVGTNRLKLSQECQGCPLAQPACMGRICRCPPPMGPR
jgi:hypothetical protein